MNNTSERKIPLDQLKIPESLIKVFKKSNPEIDDIKISDVEYFVVYNPMDFSPVYKFRVTFDLQIEWEDSRLRKPTEKYSSDLDTGFKMIYTKNVPDVVFAIGRVTYLERDYIKEFMNIFKKNKLILFIYSKTFSISSLLFFYFYINFVILKIS
jgi:hypothetical protein